MRFLLLCTVLAAAACATEPNTAPEKEWLTSAVVPLASDERDADFTRLRQVIGSARVVALGEIVHRAHELLAFRNEMFRYLVEEEGFRTIALETDLVQSRVLQDYVDGGAINIDSLAPQVFSWGFHLFGENRDLLDWMRAYNLSHGPQDQLRIYGFELPGGIGGVEFAHADATFETLLGYLARVDGPAARGFLDRLEPVLGRYTDRGYGNLSPEEQAAITASIADLHATLELAGPDLVEVSSKEEFERAVQGAQTLAQLDRYFRAAHGTLPSALPDAVRYHPLAVRDRGMWENISWILARLGPDERMMVFAHSVHLQNAPHTYEGEPVNPMGMYLKTAMRDQVVTLGTVHKEMVDSVGFGEYWAGSSSLAERMSGEGARIALLDLRSRAWPEDEDAWWTEPQRFDFGWAQSYLVPSAVFDGWVYFGRLTLHDPWK